MIINGKIHRGRHGLGGEFGYMTTIEPEEKLNNWSLLASTGNMVRYVIEKSGQSDWGWTKDLPRGCSRKRPLPRSH